MIRSFKGKYAFLSNFYTCFPNNRSVEHFYQASKATNDTDRRYVLSSPDSATAKKRGRSIKCRSDWQDIRVDCIYRFLVEKYHIPMLRKALLDTEDRELIEGNSWGDIEWGVDEKTGIGKNLLGKLLMKLRSDIRKEIEDQKKLK